MISVVDLKMPPCYCRSSQPVVDRSEKARDRDWNCYLPVAMAPVVVVVVVVAAAAAAAVAAAAAAVAIANVAVGFEL